MRISSIRSILWTLAIISVVVLGSCAVPQKKVKSEAQRGPAPVIEGDSASEGESAHIMRLDSVQPERKVKKRPGSYKNVAGSSRTEARPEEDFSGEGYSHVVENSFRSAEKAPLSTFSIDVDTASYSNVRRYVNYNKMPPSSAVRVEEMINYFSYNYPKPVGIHPFSVSTEVTECPWDARHNLIQIGILGKSIDKGQLPPSNFVFLLDVSGSMNNHDKLPLLKKGFSMLVNNIGEKDTVSIVVYAGAAGLVLPPTPGNEKKKILDALDRLGAGGSTAGAAGINLAYKVAEENMKPRGNNRVILATDGDFNVGVSSRGGLEKLVEEKREKGVFLTVLGFGTGNIQDGKMEQLADKGNGNYAYIDSVKEAKKVLVKEMGSTLFTIAKDVKIQVEFNPAKIKGYRLIGYENRKMKAEDFSDDKKDAGELGAGHTVTALYEIIPAGSDEEIPESDELKYQTTEVSAEAYKSDELVTVKLRYKLPKEDESTLLKTTISETKMVPFAESSENIRFASSVAELGLLLRNSKFKGRSSFESLIQRARESKGEDKNGYREEFIKIAEKAEKLKGKK